MLRYYKNGNFLRFFIVACGLLVAACGGADRQKARDLPQDEGLQTLLERQVLTNILAERRIAGLPTALLEEDDSLKRTARAHSLDMAARGFFSHINPEGQGPLERHRRQVTFVQGRIGENIWSTELPPGQEPNLNVLAKRSVTGWMGSPDHRALLLDPGMTQVGVGVAFSDRWVFVTLLMQSP